MKNADDSMPVLHHQYGQRVPWKQRHVATIFTEKIEHVAFQGGWHVDLGVTVGVEASTGPENLGWGSEERCAVMRPRPATCMLHTGFAPRNIWHSDFGSTTQANCYFDRQPLEVSRNTHRMQEVC